MLSHGEPGPLGLWALQMLLPEAAVPAHLFACSLPSHSAQVQKFHRQGNFSDLLQSCHVDRIKACGPNRLYHL